MTKTGEPNGQVDPFNLSRFVEAQAEVYPEALAELRRGQKRSHWMWFIFPQIAGLGFTSTSRYYAIRSLAEAREFLAHPILGNRLLECSETVMQVQGRRASDIFAPPDDLKLCSCMTLFAEVASPGSVFERVLEKYFQGKRDGRTLTLLGLDNNS